MGRKVRQEKLEEIWKTLQEKPGQRPAEVARRLGMHRSEVTRSLPSLEEAGLYLAEDDHGRLWPFYRRNSK
jgi:DNA-binding IclR family transcriptional regulator